MFSKQNEVKRHKLMSDLDDFIQEDGNFHVEVKLEEENESYEDLTFDIEAGEEMNSTKNCWNSDKDGKCHFAKNNRITDGNDGQYNISAVNELNNAYHQQIEPIFVECEEITVTDQFGSDDMRLFPEFSTSSIEPEFVDIGESIYMINDTTKDVYLDEDENTNLNGTEYEENMSPTTSINENILHELYFIIPKEAYDSLSVKIEKPQVDVEQIISMINIAMNKVDKGISDNQSAKIISENPAVFQLSNVKLRNSTDILNTVFLLMSENISENKPQLSLSNVKISSDNESLKKSLRKLVKSSDRHSNSNLSNFIKIISTRSNAYSNSYIGYEGTKLGCKSQKILIKEFENFIITKEKEFTKLKQTFRDLKQEQKLLKEAVSVERDVQTISNIMSKYLEPDAVQFFVNQMRIAGKKSGGYRWSDDDKLFALGILYKNQNEYNVLTQHYTLPTVKTLNKFVSYIKKAELEDTLVEVVIT